MASPETQAKSPQDIAHEFWAEHDVTPEEHGTTYVRNQLEKLGAGQPTWIVRNVDGAGRSYDLYTQRGIVANLLDDQGDFGSGEVELYVNDPEAQERINAELAAVRGESPGQNRELELARALALAEEIANTTG